MGKKEGFSIAIKEGNEWIDGKIYFLELGIETEAHEKTCIIPFNDMKSVTRERGNTVIKYSVITDLNKELEMIDTNIKAVHMLTKFFLKDMEKNNYGYILNVASSAAFQPGPLMATYYATKSYVYQLSEAIYYEQQKKKSNVHVSVLCPGPVATNFNNVAGVKFGVKPLKSTYVAKYAIDQMFKNKMLIIPGFTMKCTKFFGRFISDKMLLRIAYRIQKKKIN